MRPAGDHPIFIATFMPPCTLPAARYLPGMRTPTIFRPNAIRIWLAACLVHGGLRAQEHYLPLGNEVNLRYAPWLYSLESDMHTAVRPYLSSEVKRNAPMDSIDAMPVKDCAFTRSWAGRKLLSEHLLQVTGDDFTLHLDPAFEFDLMRDKDEGTLYINTRGVHVAGTLGERFSFSSSFYESQARFPGYLDSMVRSTYVVPGGARIKQFGKSFDYNIASGTVSYSLKKHFNFQFGHDKVFLGDGYRSLLLSDNAFNYPFLKITTTFWKVKYVNLYTVFQDMQIPRPEFVAFQRKHASFHFLDMRIGRRASIGILEAVIWKSDTMRNRGFDINYLNPFIFLRPVEFSLGSPDNALLGLNASYKITHSLTAYTQVMLDEFKIDQVRAGKGWWANKQAFQVGARYFNAFGVANLYLQTEFNFVRPYTYQHVSSLTAYAHYNQPIAHPLGANFRESVSIVRYSRGRFGFHGQLMLAVVGYDLPDSTGAAVNYGQNVLSSYETRPMDEGNFVGQGLRTRLTMAEGRLTYMVNPAWVFLAEAGIRTRTAVNDTGTDNMILFFFGIRTALTNRYVDF